MKRVWLGLGANLGDREAGLRTALEKLDTPELRLVKVSRIFETEPMGMREQGWFLNLCAEFETSLFPKQLLQRTQRVEHEMGRKRGLRNGPRVIDIDVLLYGSSVVRTGELEIPHPRYRERRFVLAPLAEIAPQLRDPETGATVSEMLAALNGQTARPVE